MRHSAMWANRQSRAVCCNNRAIAAGKRGGCETGRSPPEPARRKKRARRRRRRGRFQNGSTPHSENRMPPGRVRPAWCTPCPFPPRHQGRLVDLSVVVGGLGAGACRRRGRIYVRTDSGSLICIETGDPNDDGWLMWGANQGDRTISQLSCSALFRGSCRPNRR